MLIISSGRIWNTHLATMLHTYITGFDAEACWPLNGPLFSPLNPLYSLMGVGVTGPPLSTNWSGRVLQAISSVMYEYLKNKTYC